jgi:tetratricopeptide (TPR) repeat protein
VGKTQTAIRYAEEHRAEYRAVLWTGADSREALVSGFAAIAELLELPESKSRDQALAVDAVKRWLKAKSGWLLIFDNADDLRLAAEFMPRDRKGHVLLTTQAHATGTLAQRLEVCQMDEKEGALLLLRRAGILEKGAKLSDAEESDRELAQKIAGKLGGLPLALDQAGAYLEETGSGLGDYLALYQQRSAELLREQRGLGSEHPSVDATFWLSFEKVEKTNPAAGALLRLCAFLEPDAIPEEIFSQGASELGPILGQAAAAPFLLDRAIEATSTYSLLRRDAKSRTVSVHRLIQAVIKNRMDSGEQREWAERTVRAVNRAFPYVELSRWAYCERILPHAMACREIIDQWQLENPEAGRLLNQLGFYLSERSRFQNVEQILQRALEIREKLGVPERLQTLNNLAGFYRAHRRYDRAAQLYQSALTMLGEPEPAPQQARNGDEAEVPPQAAPLSPRAIYPRWQEPWDSKLGSEHPDLAWLLNNLAEVYREQGKYAEAEPLYRRALEIREQTHEGGHASVASILSNLGQLYTSQGRYSDAERLHRRALEIRQNSLNAEAPNVALSLFDLAELYRVQAKYGDAEPLFAHARKIFEAAVGPDHTDLAATLNNLALLYADQERYSEAEALYEQSQAILEKSLGPRDPDVATVIENRAALLVRTHRERQAEEFKMRAQRIRSQHRDGAAGRNPTVSADSPP